MNLIVAPYHDLRKIEMEGARTRDAHFIEEFKKVQGIDKILIINRPTSILEIILKKKKINLNGKSVYNRKRYRLIEISPNQYVIDHISKDIFSLIVLRKGWFFKAYENSNFQKFISDCIDKLDMSDAVFISQNIFASSLSSIKNIKTKIFDSWDNFARMANFQSLHKKILKSYETYSKVSDLIFTNSDENIDFYRQRFHRNDVILIKNGVSPEKFSNPIDIPSDLKKIMRPIVGFGGKITHLFDVDLFNFIVENNPKKSFVIVGQVLDKKLFSKIKNAKNFHYLGDKHYDVYPQYVVNFDLCIIPYVIKEKQHGGDSIKAYEYLATNKTVIGTDGNGLQDLKEFIYIADSKEEFSQLIKRNPLPKPVNIAPHSWRYKAEMILSSIKTL